MTGSTDVTVVVPAHDEAGRVGRVVAELVERGYRVVVVDDGSSDDTASEAREAGASVRRFEENRGYVAALKAGFRAAETDVVVTYDADGEHRPEDVAPLVAPVLAGDLDLVMGARQSIPRPSERLLDRLARLRVDVNDTGSGLRALRRDLALSLDLDATCTCGTLVLEAVARGARVGDVPVRTREIREPRGVAWYHARQFFDVLRYLARPPSRADARGATTPSRVYPSARPRGRMDPTWWALVGLFGGLLLVFLLFLYARLVAR